MKQLYDKIYGELAIVVNLKVMNGELDNQRGEELKKLISDWLFDKEREDEEIRTSYLDRLFSWGSDDQKIPVMGNEADQGEAMERAGVVFSNEKAEGIVL